MIDSTIVDETLEFPVGSLSSSPPLHERPQPTLFILGLGALLWLSAVPTAHLPWQPG
jgi:hypothetical protein